MQNHQQNLKNKSTSLLIMHKLLGSIIDKCAYVWKQNYQKNIHCLYA